MLIGVLALATMLAPSARAADCPASVERDKQFIAAELARLKVLAPAPPKGWKLYDTRQTLPAAQSACGKNGSPSTPPVRVEYEIIAYPADAPQFRIRELKSGVDSSSKSSAPSVEQATRDLQAVANSRDVAAIQKANAEMQQALGAVNGVNQKSIANIREITRLENLPQPNPIHIKLLANYDVIDLCEERTNLMLDGAVYAFRFDKRPPCTTGPFVGAAVTAAVVAIVGDWRRDGARYIANYEYVRAARVVPFYEVYTIVAVINGSDNGAVRAAAALLDVSALAKASAARAK